MSMLPQFNTRCHGHGRSKLFVPDYTDDILGGEARPKARACNTGMLTYPHSLFTHERTTNQTVRHTCSSIRHGNPGSRQTTDKLQTHTHTHTCTANHSTIIIKWHPAQGRQASGLHTLLAAPATSGHPRQGRVPYHRMRLSLQGLGHGLSPTVASTTVKPSRAATRITVYLQPA